MIVYYAMFGNYSQGRFETREAAEAFLEQQKAELVANDSLLRLKLIKESTQCTN